MLHIDVEQEEKRKKEKNPSWGGTSPIYNHSMANDFPICLYFPNILEFYYQLIEGVAHLSSSLIVDPKRALVTNLRKRVRIKRKEEKKKTKRDRFFPTREVPAYPQNRC